MAATKKTNVKSAAPAKKGKAASGGALGGATKTAAKTAAKSAAVKSTTAKSTAAKSTTAKSGVAKGATAKSATAKSTTASGGAAKTAVKKAPAAASVGAARGGDVAQYDESKIKTLSSLEHIRLRTGMYIGRLGDGSSPDDGIYVLLKEIVDNGIDEFIMGNGKLIEVAIANGAEPGAATVSVRDYGRGIPLGKLVECVSVHNPGRK